MSSDAFKLQGTIDVDVNEAVSSLKKVDSTVESSGSKMDGFSSKIAGVGKALVAAFSVKAIADFGAKCLNAASDVEEMENKFNVVFDGMTEEVNGFDVPVPYLDAEFDLALLGKKGTWYDHKVSVSDPVRIEK